MSTLVIRLNNAYCSCGEWIGRHQHVYEMAIDNQPGINPVEVLNQMKLPLMCCRNQMMNASMQFITDSNSTRFINESETMSIENKTSYQSGDPIYPNQILKLPLLTPSRQTSEPIITIDIPAPIVTTLF